MITRTPYFSLFFVHAQQLLLKSSVHRLIAPVTRFYPPLFLVAVKSFSEWKRSHRYVTYHNARNYISCERRVQNIGRSCLENNRKHLDFVKGQSVILSSNVSLPFLNRSQLIIEAPRHREKTLETLILVPVRILEKSSSAGTSS